MSAKRKTESQLKKQRLLNRKNAVLYLKELAEIKTCGSQFYYLRKLDPFVFEEMILTALKNQGYRIIRNKAYTGDGGVDGMVFMNMKRHLIQAKCYSEHIKALDVEEFTRICKKRNVKGLFVHTGRTGAKSWGAARDSNVEIVSGEPMLNLLLGRPFRRKTEFTDIVNRAFSSE